MNAIAKEITLRAPAVVRMMKRSIYDGLDRDPVKAAEMELLLHSRTFEMEDSNTFINIRPGDR